MSIAPNMSAALTAIQADGWELIENTTPGEGIPEVELYDARTDRLDAHDVAAEHADVVVDLRAKLGAWRIEVAKLRLKSSTPADANLSADEIERLKSLGYVQ